MSSPSCCCCLTVMCKLSPASSTRHQYPQIEMQLGSMFSTGCHINVDAHNLRSGSILCLMS